MEWLSPVLLAIQVTSSLSIIVLVLLQQGKGADMGSSFGGGSAGSLFGATGAANFLSRTTKWAAIIFFVSTGGLAYMAHHPADKAALDSGVMQGFEVPATDSSVPAVPGAAVPAVPAVPQEPSRPAPAGDASVPSTSSAPTVPDAPAAPDAPVPAVPETPAQSQ